MPVGVQRKRSKGWKMPPNTVSVTRPGKWGNPFVVGTPVYFFDKEIIKFFFPHLLGDGRLTEKDCIEAHMKWLKETSEGRSIAAAAKQELAGKNLACWCPVGAPCHRDNLLKIANE